MWDSGLPYLLTERAVFNQIIVIRSRLALVSTGAEIQVGDCLGKFILSLSAL